MRILAVLNTYNLSSMPHYVSESLRLWAAQAIPDNYHLDVVVSDVLSNENAKNEIVNYINTLQQPNKSFYFLTVKDGNVPVYVSFNTAIHYFNKQNGLYDYYIYSAEDCSMSNPTDLMNVLSEFKTNQDIGHVSALVDIDNTIFYPQYNKFKANAPPFEIALGESVNMHFSVWDRRFMEKFDFRYVDVFTAYATESLYTFINASIGTKWVHCRKVVLAHRRSGKPKGYLGYSTFRDFKDVDDILKNGTQFGLGFECWMANIRPEKRKHWHPFRRGAYSKQGVLKDRNKLYNYIKSNLFLPKEVLDYEERIKSVIVSGK